MSAIGTGGPNDPGDPYDPHTLARAARARELVMRGAAVEAARTLERLASHRQPISPAQALAVAQKIRRDVHEA